MYNSAGGEMAVQYETYDTYDTMDTYEADEASKMTLTLLYLHAMLAFQW